MCDEVKPRRQISDEDIERTINHQPMSCAPGATVTWTRYGRLGDDPAPEISHWFVARNVNEGVLRRLRRVQLSHRFITDPPPFEAGVRVFQFLR